MKPFPRKLPWIPGSFPRKRSWIPGSFPRKLPCLCVVLLKAAKPCFPLLLSEHALTAIILTSLEANLGS